MKAKKIALLGSTLLLGTTILAACGSDTHKQNAAIDRELNDLRTKYNLAEQADKEKTSEETKQSTGTESPAETDSTTPSTKDGTTTQEKATQEKSTDTTKNEPTDAYASVEGETLQMTAITEEEGLKHFGNTLQNGLTLFNKAGYIVGKDGTLLISLRDGTDEPLRVQVAESKVTSDGVLYVKVAAKDENGDGLGFLKYAPTDVKQIKVYYGDAYLTEFTEQNYL